MRKNPFINLAKIFKCGIRWIFMVVQIGVKYHANKQRVAELIRQDKVKAIDLPFSDTCCYFCLERLCERVVLVAIEGVDSRGNKTVERYLLDPDCFLQARLGYTGTVKTRRN